jgi:hypothetical protein
MLEKKILLSLLNFRYYLKDVKENIETYENQIKEVEKIKMKFDRSIENTRLKLG